MTERGAATTPTMTANTKAVFLAVCKGDPTITTEQQEAALLALESNHTATGDAAPDPGRVLRPKEVAARLGVSRKTLCAYGKRGLLDSVYAADKPNRRLGYTEASVRAFISGHAVRA